MRIAVPAWRTAMVLLAVLLGTALPAPGQQKEGGKGGGRPQQRAAPVVVAPVTRVNRAPTFEYAGLIQPAEKALLSAEVSGRVKTVARRQGDVVASGEVVAVLENPSMERELSVLQARLQATKADLNLKRQQHARITGLYKKNLTSTEQLEDSNASLAVAEAKLKADQAQVEQLEDQLARMVIRSPIAGQVVHEELEVGQWVTPNNPLFEIYNYESFEVLVGVPGRYLPTVPETGQVRMTIPEISRTLRGDIVSKVHHVARETGNFTLRLRVQNPANLPLSGMLARVDVPLGPVREVLTVPRDAIVRQGGRTHVAIVREGSAQIVTVQIEGNVGNDVIVSGDGLRSGDEVVVRGNERLFPGMPVKVTKTLSS